MHQSHTAVDTATQVELELGNALEVVEVEDTTQDSVDFSLIEILPSGRVSARNLYKFLELNSTQTARWLASKIEENDFAIENEDYWGYDIVVAGNKTRDFELTPNFAKKLAMMSKSKRGEQVRDYFLAMEETVLKPKALPSYSEALRLLADNIEENERLQSENRVMLPKANYFDNIVDKNLLTNISTTAKLLEMKIKTFTQFLLDSKLVFRTASKMKLDKKTGLEKEVIGKLLPHSDYCNKEKPNSLYFEVKEFATSGYANTQTMITPRGKEAIILMLGKNR